MPLREKQHYIFDMDGTLTVAVHDFEHIRKALDLPSDQPILEAISRRPEEEQRELNRQLDELELVYAREARQQPEAENLLSALCNAGCSLGILTRNSTELALVTLETCGLLRFFHEDAILGRDRCDPKPSPDGIFHLLQLWGTGTEQAVMVGDFRFDLEAGRAAGITTIHLNTDGQTGWPDLTDHGVSTLLTIKELAGI